MLVKKQFGHKDTNSADILATTVTYSLLKYSRILVAFVIYIASCDGSGVMRQTTLSRPEHMVNAWISSKFSLDLSTIYFSNFSGH